MISFGTILLSIVSSVIGALFGVVFTKIFDLSPNLKNQFVSYQNFTKILVNFNFFYEYINQMESVDIGELEPYIRQFNKDINGLNSCVQKSIDKINYQKILLLLQEVTNEKYRIENFSTDKEILKTELQNYNTQIEIIRNKKIRFVNYKVKSIGNIN